MARQAVGLRQDRLRPAYCYIHRTQAGVGSRLRYVNVKSLNALFTTAGQCVANLTLSTPLADGVPPRSPVYRHRDLFLSLSLSHTGTTTAVPVNADLLYMFIPSSDARYSNIPDSNIGDTAIPVHGGI